MKRRGEGVFEYVKRSSSDAFNVLVRLKRNVYSTTAECAHRICQRLVCTILRGAVLISVSLHELLYMCPRSLSTLTILSVLSCSPSLSSCRPARARAIKTTLLTCDLTATQIMEALPVHRAAAPWLLVISASSRRPSFLSPAAFEGKNLRLL